ncbi:hypothetical protein PR048_018723 [Dryococelus australis]|uniref:PiggyBac transposable element-derived protein domain-containing protein n=1 Tax=Dryococelus australis TaxID=614101 RepID=A0ABQ9HDC4_9NEOP|nr:hypothetical protein PR048_018723 [Dryococelus australis]
MEQRMAYRMKCRSRNMMQPSTTDKLMLIYLATVNYTPLGVFITIWLWEPMNTITVSDWLPPIGSTAGWQVRFIDDKMLERVAGVRLTRGENQVNGPQRSAFSDPKVPWMTSPPRMSGKVMDLSGESFFVAGVIPSTLVVGLSRLTVKGSGRRGAGDEETPCCYVPLPQSWMSLGKAQIFPKELTGISESSELGARWRSGDVTTCRLFGSGSGAARPSVHQPTELYYSHSLREELRMEQHRNERAGETKRSPRTPADRRPRWEASSLITAAPAFTKGEYFLSFIYLDTSGRGQVYNERGYMRSRVDVQLPGAHVRTMSARRRCGATAVPQRSMSALIAQWIEESDATTSEQNIATDIEDPPFVCFHSQHSGSSEIESEDSGSEECDGDSQPPANNHPATKIYKLAQVRYIWKLFISQCQKTVIPTECLPIDEQLVTFGGRSSLVQYMPSKPGKYGIKIFLDLRT